MTEKNKVVHVTSPETMARWEKRGKCGYSMAQTLKVKKESAWEKFRKKVIVCNWDDEENTELNEN